MKRLAMAILITILPVPSSEASGDSIPPGCGIIVDEPADQQARVAGLIAGLRESGKGKLADEIKDRFDRSAKEVAQRNPGGHTIYGRVVVEGPDDPKRVQAQMRILDDGFFVGSVGQAGLPVGFRLHGFEPVDVIPLGGPGSIEDAGIVYLRRLDESKMASLKGKVVLEGQPDVPEALVGLGITTGPINNATGGYEGVRGLPIPSIQVTRDGIIDGSGYVPTEHTLYVKAPGYWIAYRSINFQPGRTLDLGTIQLDLGELVTVTSMLAKGGPSFAEAKPFTVTTDASAGWRVSDQAQRWDYLLFLYRLDENRLRFRSSHGPFELADLGVGSVEEQAKMDHRKVQFAPDRSIVPESGHVYLGHWGFANEWVLFHLKREKMTPEVARKLKLDRP